MIKPLTVALMHVATQQPLALASHELPALFDRPDYQWDALELGDDKGRRSDRHSDAKGLLAVPRCEQYLRQIYPGAQVTCTPSFPLGYSETVPLKAVVKEKNGSINKLFIKSFDDSNGTLEEIEKEFLWQQALWAGGVTTIPKPLLFDATARLFVSCQAKGVSAAKNLFDVPLYRNQVAQIIADIHALDIDALPSETHLFLRPVQEALDAGLNAGHLDSGIAHGISTYAHLIEDAISIRYDPSTMATAVHGDMKAGNMLVQLEQKTLTFTDFGLAHRGDPASDKAFFSPTATAPWPTYTRLSATTQAARRCLSISLNAPCYTPLTIG